MAFRRLLFSWRDVRTSIVPSGLQQGDRRSQLFPPIGLDNPAAEIKVRPLEATAGAFKAGCLRIVGSIPRG
jgi:hypothetical protein